MFQKLEHYIFYIFLFSIPFQVRKILYFSEWRFNEWQSISVYATDVLLVILLVFWLFNFSFKLKKSDYFLLAFLAISAISIKNANNHLVSSFQWIKLVEFVIFYWYLSNYALKKFGLYNFFMAILVGGVFQAVIAIIQFLKQSSLGLKYLGESFINSDLSGIASFYLPSGEKIIRAYGTTPHPNVLASFLLLAIFGFYFVYLYSKLHSEHSPLADRWDKFMLVSYILMLFSFFSTFSRTVIFAFFATFCLRGMIILIRKHYRLVFGTQQGRKRIRAILLCGLAAILIFGSFYFDEIKSRISIDGEDQAVQLRSFYAKEAMSGEIKWFGVGIGNFVSWMVEKNPFLPPYAYQPVHNIYLLLYSENGILGLIAFLGFLIFAVKDFIVKTRLKKSYHLSLLFFFGSLIFIGFFDHLFMTLQRGRLIFWTGLGMLTFFSKDDII